MTEKGRRIDKSDEQKLLEFRDWLETQFLQIIEKRALEARRVGVKVNGYRWHYLFWRSLPVTAHAMGILGGHGVVASYVMEGNKVAWVYPRGFPTVPLTPDLAFWMSERRGKGEWNVTPPSELLAPPENLLLSFVPWSAAIRGEGPSGRGPRGRRKAG